MISLLIFFSMLRTRFVASFALISLLLAGSPLSAVHAATSVANPGDLIRGTSFSAVYYMGEDGFRYVFPNDKTYATWYSNFDSVKMLSDKDLATIQMGGNVTYKPGVKMIKINSDPKTYFVTQGGILRWVSSEADATAMYGTNWNTKIDDVQDSFFGNYTIGDTLDLSTATPPTSVPSATSTSTPTITTDKNLTTFTEISIAGMAFPSRIAVAVGHTVKFVNNDTVDHAATADDNSWGSGTLHSGDTFVRKFSTPGTYTYHCYYHPEMTATIIVQ